MPARSLPQAMRARGADMLALARSLDAAARHATRRDARARRRRSTLRPKQLSVTRIETLIRDPYAIYARMS